MSMDEKAPGSKLKGDPRSPPSPSHRAKRSINPDV